MPVETEKIKIIVFFIKLARKAVINIQNFLYRRITPENSKILSTFPGVYCINV